MAVIDRPTEKTLVYTDTEVETLKRAAARSLAQMARQGITVDYKPHGLPIRKVPLKGMIVPGFADELCRC